MPFQIRTQRQNASACKLNYPLTSVSKSLLWIGGQSSSKTKSPCMNIYFWTQKLQRATTNIINNHKTFIYIYKKKKFIAKECKEFFPLWFLRCFWFVFILPTQHLCIVNTNSKLQPLNTYSTQHLMDVHLYMCTLFMIHWPCQTDE